MPDMVMDMEDFEADAIEMVPEVRAWYDAAFDEATARGLEPTPVRHAALTRARHRGDDPRAAARALA